MLVFLWQADCATFRDRFDKLELRLYPSGAASSPSLRRELLQMHQTSDRLRSQLERWTLAYKLGSSSLTIPIKRLSETSSPL